MPDASSSTMPDAHPPSMAADAGNTDDDGGILDADADASLVDAGNDELSVVDAGCPIGTWQDLLGDDDDIASARASDLSPANLSYEPTVNGGLVWIDQRNGVNFPPHLQKWGQVFTAPATQGPMLLWVSFYVSPTGASPATYFKIRLTQWSDEQPGPTGATLYQSEAVFFATDNPNPAGNPGKRPTVFEVNTAVVPGQKYFIEIAGDGSTDMDMASGYTDEGLYLTQDCMPWDQFGGWALRSDMAFSDP